MDTAESKRIAGTILAQLGGNRFVAMTGAKYMSHDTRNKLIKFFKG